MNIFCVGFVIVVTTVTVVLMKNCDKLGVILYEDLGCIPQYDQISDCPVRYKCEGLEPWNNQCHFRGNIYDKNQIVEDNLSSLSCDKACFCNSLGTRLHFLCAILDCPEWLGQTVTPGCYRKYSLEDCCSTGQICPPFSDDAKCTVDGVVYKEGEQFYPRDFCLKCICQRGFQDKLEEPFCRRRTCGEQLKNALILQDACAPVYNSKLDEVLCCPKEWICSDGTEVIKGEAKSDDICKFGSRTVKVGQMLEKSDVGNIGKVICQCVIPPLLLCNIPN